VELSQSEELQDLFAGGVKLVDTIEQVEVIKIMFFGIK
jgi:hypothetical protein